MIHQTLEYTSSVTPSFMRKTQAKPSVDSSDVKKTSLMEEEEEDHETISYEGVGEGGWKLEGLRHRRGGQGKLAELFRKDLISAMKLPDTEQLQPEDYVLISDPWRQEWEKGVQVPVSPELIPNTSVQPITGREKMHGLYGFKLPRKFLHASKDETYQQGVHELHETQKLAEQVCRYDLDNLDVAWLHRVNDERSSMGQQQIEEWVMEKIIEELEAQCHDNMEIMIKTVEGLGIEYDENIICDVCRSPESEDTNEMVFCDGCDICVHQACYGIQKIPEGSWLCRTCALGIRPKCILCPNMGGAMKSTKSGTKWSHVACALWVPEVSIGCPEKMEPITKISQIPSSRWALVCSLCRERTGACIQCSVKTCKTAFHVSCAFRHGLEMKTQLDDKEDDVKLQGFCAKHSKKLTGSPQKDPFTGSPRKEMTEAEKTELRSHRLSKLAEEFYTCVKVPDVAASINVPEDIVDFIFSYWTLKRKANFNKPLLTPKKEEEDLLSRQQEDSLVARMKMFVHLRQDLERVRNLCYMVTKREKMRRHLYCMKEELFRKQAAIMENQAQPISSRHAMPIITAHHSCGLYDRYDEILLASERGFKEVDLKPMFKDKQARVSVHTLSESLSVNNNDSKWNVPNRRTSINDQLGIGVGKKEQKLEENTPVRNLFGSDYVNSKNCHKPDRTATAVKPSPSAEPMDTSCTVVTRGGRVAKRISLTKTEGEPVSACATVNTTQTSQSVNSETHSNSQRTDKVITEKAPVTPGRPERNQFNSEKDQVRLGRSLAKHDKEQVKADKSQIKVEKDQGSADKDQVRPEKDVVRTETNLAKTDKGQVKPEVTGSPPDKSGTTKGLSKLEREQRRLTTWADLRSEAQGEHAAVTGRRPRLSLSGYEADPQTESKPQRRHSHCIKVANGVIQNSKLVVGESIKEKVQSRLHKAKLSANLTNGVHDAVEKMVKREALASTSGEQRGSLKHLDQLPAQRNNGTRGAVNSMHQSLLSFSPHATLGGYKIPKKSPETKGVNMGHTTPLGKRPHSESSLDSPETRSVRRRIEADCESTSSNHQFETVDGEISLRSSRSSTPDIENAQRLPKRSSRRSLAQRVAKKLNSDLSHMGSEVSGSTSDIDLGSDSEYAPSEAPSVSSSSTHQSDRAGIDALPGHRNHSQARHIDQWSRTLRSNS